MNDRTLTPEPRMAEIAERIERATRKDGMHASAIKNLRLARASAPSTPMPGITEPCVCVMAQGRKRILLGEEAFIYDPANYLVASVDLPVAGAVLDATPERPYLGLALRVDPKEIASLLLQTKLPAPPAAPARGMYVAKLDRALIEAVLRLLHLLDTPDDIPTLAPLAEREILYRLLKGPEGWRLRQMANAQSHATRIAKSIQWLKANYAEPLRVAELAKSASMSASTFHEHFRAVTAMSPLQYQKHLRLQEARRLLLAEASDAATAGHRVGYESPSQFSREYSRMFGASPAADARRLRATV
jgi:AraC-like DNA-binding protein